MFVETHGAGRALDVWAPTTPHRAHPQTVARPLVVGRRLPAGSGGESLSRAIRARPAGEYLLLDPDGSIFGVLSTSDVDRAFRAHA